MLCHIITCCYVFQYLSCLSTSSSSDKLAFDVGLQESAQGKRKFGFYMDLHLKAQKMKICVVKFANSTDPNEAAHYELSHMDLHCLQCI